MSRPNSIHIGQLALLLIIATIVLIVGDRNRWFDSTRSLVEEKILRVRVVHRETEKEKFARLESKVVSLEQELGLLKDENNSLRRQLQAPLAPNLSFTPAYIVSIDISKEDAIARIAAGSLEDIQVGMPVVSDKILIGIISHITPKISHVTLLSSPKSKIAVKTEKGARGLIIGSATETTNTVLLDRVLQTEDLNEGDIIVSSGEDGLPINLVIGKVAHIISEAREPFQRAEVDLAVDVNDLRRVFVVGE